MAHTSACRAGPIIADVAEQTFKSSGGKVPQATFSLAMIRTLFESAQLYSRQQMKDTGKMTILCQRAQTVLS